MCLRFASSKNSERRSVNLLIYEFYSSLNMFFKAQASDFLLTAHKKAMALIDLIDLGKLDSFLTKLKKYIRSRSSFSRVW